MNKDNLHTEILRYGRIVKDMDFDMLKYKPEFTAECHKIRIISYRGNLYYDHMCNGSILECHQLSPVKEK